jgi:CRP-like cAMP-binding protein
MYFLQKGVVDVVAEDGQTVFASMERGAFFGEISLLFSCPRTASIRAKTACDMFTLSRAVSA